MKANAEKCYFICSSNKNANLTFENDQILKYICGKLLDVKIGSKFNFNTHVNDICKKARQKLNTLARITQYWDFDKRIIIWMPFFFHNLISVSYLGCVLTV